MSRVIHFELGADDPEKLSRFYEEVFGWQVRRWDGPQAYWLITTGEKGKEGINGGIMRHNDCLPRTVNTIDVESVEEFCEKVKAAGGEVVVPKMAIPGVGYQAYCKDPEGILFGIHERDSSAREEDSEV
jgi:predicted enzyme related to lactoylglutathione lyase